MEGEGETSGVYGDTGVKQRERGVEGEGETSGVYGDTGVYTALYRSFPVSNREREGWRERGRHQVFMVTPMSIPLCMDRF